MKRLVVGLAVGAFAACAGIVAAQNTAPAADTASTTGDVNRAKQEMVKSTTEAQTKQMSGAGYHGAKPTTEAKKLSNDEKQQVMSGVAKSAKDQYRPITPPQAAGTGKSAPKAARPRMSDPEMQETIKKQQHS